MLISIKSQWYWWILCWFREAERHEEPSREERKEETTEEESNNAHAEALSKILAEMQPIIPKDQSQFDLLDLMDDLSWSQKCSVYTSIAFHCTYLNKCHIVKA